MGCPSLLRNGAPSPPEPKLNSRLDASIDCGTNPLGGVDPPSGRRSVQREARFLDWVMSRPGRSSHRWNWVRREADGFSIVLFGIPGR